MDLFLVGALIGLGIFFGTSQKEKEKHNMNKWYWYVLAAVLGWLLVGFVLNEIADKISRKGS